MEKSSIAELIERNEGELNVEIVQYLCPILFQHQVYKRKRIIAIIHDYVLQETGLDIDKQIMISRVRHIIKKDKLLFRPNNPIGGTGNYEYIGPIGEDDDASQPKQEVNNDTFIMDIKAEETRGYGEYKVYAWCLPLYREHPNSEGRYRIKIGMATRNFLALQQDIQANLPEKQMFLAEFRRPSKSAAQELEKSFHIIFKKWKIKDIPGQEWFSISKEEIIKAYDSYFEIDPPIPNHAENSFSDAR